MNPSLLLPDRDLLHFDGVVLSPEALTLVVSAVQPLAFCPGGGQPASRVHSAYVRTSADSPCCGVKRRTELSRDQPDRARRIFAEPLPSIAKRYARRATRLAQTLAKIAYVLGGEAGAQIAAGLDIPISQDTLLRQLRRLPPSAARHAGLGRR